MQTTGSFSMGGTVGATSPQPSGVIKDTTTRDFKADVIAVASHQAGFDALKSGQIDAYFGDQAILIHMLVANDKTDDLTISDNTLTIEKQALGLPLGDSAYRLAVDRALSNLYHSGRMVEIFKTNLPGTRPSPAISDAAK